MAIPVLSSKKRVFIILVVLALLSLGLCAGNGFIFFMERVDYSNLISAIDQDLLQRTEVTKYYYRLAWHHSEEIIEISNLMSTPELLQAANVMDSWLPNFRALLNGEGELKTISANQVNGLSDLLEYYSQRGSPSLQRNIEKELHRLDLPDFIGLTMAEAWNHIHEIWKDDDPNILPFNIDPGDLIPQPHGELFPDVPFGKYWRVFRVPVSGFAFAYPFDWTVYASKSSENRSLKICNYDEREFTPDLFQSDIECIRIDSVSESDISQPVEDIAIKLFCPQYKFIQCDVLPPPEGISAAPDQLSLRYQRLDMPFLGRNLSIYRMRSGAMVNFSTKYRGYLSYITRPYLGIVKSFMPDANGSVEAPEFIPVEPQPFPPGAQSRVELEWALHPTMTPTATAYPLLPWTPQATNNTGPYAGFWAEYRDSEDQYGFAYPADWVLQSQPDDYVPEKEMELCNNNASEYDRDNPLMICITIRERLTNLNLTLYEAANSLSRQFPGIDTYGALLEADLALDSLSNPERVLYHFKMALDVNYEDLRTGYMVFFRDSRGKMIIFSGWARDMSTAEAQAVIDSFVFGPNAQIISPDFIPSRLVDFNQ
jgi:hypothetical protein